MSEPIDQLTVLNAIDRLRRELSKYHGQLLAYNDLERHCENQRKRIAELEGLYAAAKAERTCYLTLDGTGGNYGCSACSENVPPLSNYCPNCGAKAVE